MKIAYLRLQGFRGFNQPTFLDFSPSFVVITGRNGSGKSTLCDAIEFALTGSIRRGSTHSERGENISDYLWWRGSAAAKDSFVELGLRTDGGEVLSIRRSPGASQGDLGILRDKLVDPQFQLQDPLGQLCATSIIRDEEISAASVDMQEADRYRFVRESLGTLDLGRTSKRAADAKEILDTQLRLATESYNGTRERVVSLTSTLSSAKALASQARGAKSAELELRALTRSPSTDIRSLLDASERMLALNRAQLSRLTEAEAAVLELRTEREAIAKANTVEELSRLESQLEAARAQRKELQRQMDEARLQQDRSREVLTQTASLAELLLHGARVGLRNGRCPLCATAQTPEHFSQGLEQLRQVVSASESSRAELVDSRRREAEEASTVEKSISDLEVSLAKLRSRLQSLNRQENRARALLHDLLKGAPDDLDAAVPALAVAIEAARESAITGDAALAQLRGSQATEEVARLEASLRLEEASSAEARRRISTIEKAIATMNAALRIIPRIQGEAVGEQLGALSPLLLDLYSRLKPHMDWRKMRYNLRGDVRRLLSLEVGDGLNPSFLFSSGQRRAVGLAFLLAVHLSRGWSKLRSLVLDDPMQHIDDYRALHLVEVLSAIRKTGRQVICTAEDPELARFLARRLQGQADTPGVIAELRYESGHGARIENAIEVALLSRRLLVAS